MSHGWLSDAAARRPDHPALEAGGEAISYAQLHARASRAARRLAARGIEEGDRVAIALPPGTAFVETLHGCLLLGAVAMPIDVRLGEVERAAQAASAALVVERELDAPERETTLADRPDPSAVAVVIHTSGTTGSPRPVELTYANWRASAFAAAERLGLDPAERWLCVLPVSHVGGLSIILRSAIHATTATVHSRFDVEAVAAALSDERVTLVSLVPTMLTRLIDAGARPGSSLRCALIGGGPLGVLQAKRAADAGFPLAQTYGMTEACSQVTTSKIGEPATAGRPLDGTTLRIAPGGEILVAGPTVAPGATDSEGFLHTGDLGRLDPAGRLIVTGRRTEIIVSGGENVAPAEVEAVLEAHPAVAEAAVRGRPDPEWGEAVVATVVLAPAMRAEAEELRAHCRGALAAFKVPKEVRFAPSLPRTPSGKVRRDLLDW